MIGTITLNPSLDHHWFVDDFVKDDTNRARQVIETPGGKGINVSKVVRELGGKTRAFALLGGVTGAHLEKLARPLDFPLEAVRIQGSTRINMVLTELEGRTQSRISAPGPTVRPAELRRLIRQLCSFHPHPAFWAFGGSLPPGLTAGTYRKMIGALQKHGVPCVLDTDGQALKEGVKASPFMIKPNEFEMARLCGRKLHTVRDYADEAGKLVRKNGIHLVVVSLAAKGALFVSGEGAFRVTTPAVAVRSHIGAGDSLIGGVVLGLSQKMPLRKAALLGVAASTSSVMRAAPRLCRRSDIPGLLKRLTIQEL